MNETGITLFIALTTAHLAGDFIFQTNKDVAAKNKPAVFIKHVFLISVLSYLLCGLWTEWRIALFIFLTHGFLDFIKIAVFKNNDDYKKQLTIFSLDQSLHIVVIIIISAYFQFQLIEHNFFWLDLLHNAYNNILVIISSVILLTKTGGIIIGFLISPFLKQMQVPLAAAENSNRFRGFINGGRIIGYLERILIFIFVYSGSLAAVGFLIAAKSIFRFGELSRPDRRMEAEYIIIGTLYSFTFALLISFGTVYLLNNVLVQW